jgi:MYXO-CTERM domain-containing protein
VRFSASASIKDGVTGITTQGASAIPAPGAASLLAIAALAGGRRRRH